MRKSSHHAAATAQHQRVTPSPLWISLSLQSDVTKVTFQYYNQWEEKSKLQWQEKACAETVLANFRSHKRTGHLRGHRATVTVEQVSRSKTGEWESCFVSRGCSMSSSSKEASPPTCLPSGYYSSNSQMQSSWTHAGLFISCVPNRNEGRDLMCWIHTYK